MKIGIIDNYDSFVFNLVRYIKEYNGTEVFVQRNNLVDFSLLDNCDAILLSPGPGIPNEAGQLMEIIQRYHTSKPILGVCLGHQALGEFFGGTLEQCPEPIHGKSSIMEVLDKKLLFKDLPDTLEIGRYHSWQVNIRHIPGLKITGITDEIVMAFEHESYPVCGVQFHPESILTPMGRTMINNWLNSVK